VNNGGTGGVSNALTNAHEPTVKNIFDNIINIQHPASSKAFSAVSDATVKNGKNMSVRGIMLTNTARPLPKTNHLHRDGMQRY
jgi:hypothetical protein